MAIPQQQEGRWRSLFDGKTLTGWKGANGEKVGDAWQVIDGSLVLTAGGGGDILTQETFTDFELQLEWKISEKGNSGILYRVADDDQPVWASGIEYQILDNTGYPILKGTNEIAGSVFALYAPATEVDKPTGSYNKTRILLKDAQVEHWLNGHKIVSYNLKSDDWKQRVSNSKFSMYKKFGQLQSGHIALQDHGNRVWYKNIKIIEL
ncbi:MAG: DUF1080 domain-containing protein [Gammaproteobacteria bacterium]|nr:DUF1080 domain-containing protein [Gammaproteobacteria bacterium]